jgi:hypothetical protein
MERERISHNADNSFDNNAGLDIDFRMEDDVLLLLIIPDFSEWKTMFDSFDNTRFSEWKTMFCFF